MDRHILGLLTIRATEAETARVIARHAETGRILLSDAFGEIVAWCWRNEPHEAVNAVVALIAGLDGTIAPPAALVDRVLDALPLVLHPAGKGEGSVIASGLRPQVRAHLGL